MDIRDVLTRLEKKIRDNNNCFIADVCYICENENNTFIEANVECRFALGGYEDDELQVSIKSKDSNEYHIVFNDTYQQFNVVGRDNIKIHINGIGKSSGKMLGKYTVVLDNIRV